MINLYDTPNPCVVLDKDETHAAWQACSTLLDLNAVEGEDKELLENMINQFARILR